MPMDSFKITEVDVAEVVAAEKVEDAEAEGEDEGVRQAPTRKDG